MSTTINRDFTIQFPLSNVKTAIEVVHSKDPGNIQITNRNEVFNTYTITLVGTLMYMVNFTLQLKAINENETQITINHTLPIGREAAVNNGYIDRYTNKLAESLSLNEELTPELQQKSKAASCMVVFLIGIAALALMSFILI